MNLLKCFNKIMFKYQQQKVKVINCCLTQQQQTPIKRIKVAIQSTNSSVCSPCCTRTKTQFCKCCGKKLNDKQNIKHPTRHYLKKSKAMSQMKPLKQRDSLNRSRCQKRLSSSSQVIIRREKRLKVASFISSTLIIEHNHEMKRRKQILKENNKSSFLVEFSSTPIKIAPKTSTPIKRLLF